MQVAQCDGTHVEQVAMARELLEKAIGGGQRVVEAALLDQRLQLAQFRFQSRLYFGGWHRGMMQDCVAI